MVYYFPVHAYVRAHEHTILVISPGEPHPHNDVLWDEKNSVHPLIPGEPELTDFLPVVFLKEQFRDNCTCFPMFI